MTTRPNGAGSAATKEAAPTTPPAETTSRPLAFDIDRIVLSDLRARIKDDTARLDGELLLATDWEDYAEHMVSMVATDRRLEPDHPLQRPGRPVTAYEQRGLDAGRPIRDLRYRRTGGDGATSSG